MESKLAFTPDILCKELPKEFEKLLIDFSSAKYGGTADLFGRQGQKQDGIDIIVTLRPRFSQSKQTCVQDLICVQCKDYKSTKVTTNKIDAWIQEAEAFPFPIQTLVIAVVIERDVTLQSHVICINQDRLQQGKFSVEIVFWDSIAHFVKQNDKILKMYYPMLYNAHISTIQSATSSPYSSLILNEDDLKLSFMNICVKYYVTDFMKVTPFIGFNIDLVGQYDAFEIEWLRIRDRAIQLVNTQKYKEINDFVVKISEFVTYIGLKSFITDTGMVQIRPEIRTQWTISKAIEKELEQKRTNVIELFQKVLR